MKKQYIKPVVMLIDTDILSNVMAASGSGSGSGTGGASWQNGGGTSGVEDEGKGGVNKMGDDEFDGMGTKGSIFTWYDDEDEEYCY